MEYAFQRPHQVDRQLRAIACRQIDEALKALTASAHDRPDAVHEIRKGCKKLRGLIRLVRPGFADYPVENRTFRTVAHLFDDLRDAKVLHDTSRLLAQACRDEAEREALLETGRTLASHGMNLLAKADWKGRKKRARQLLEQARKRALEWSLTEQGWDVLGGGLEKTYGRALEAMRQAGRAPTGPNLHEWRKRTKYHMYHTRLLHHLNPKLLHERAVLLDLLSDELGRHHDIHVFMTALSTHPAAGGDAARLAVVRVLAERQSALIAHRASRTGALLFDDPPQVLSRLWGEWWSAWEEQARDRNP